MSADVSASFAVQDEKSKKRGSYATQACENCKSKHLKCGGQKPVCLACERSGTLCLYSSFTIKRGRKRRKADDNSQSEIVAVGNLAESYNLGDTVPASVFQALIRELHKQQMETKTWQTRFSFLQKQMSVQTTPLPLVVPPEKYAFGLTESLIEVCLATYRESVLPFLSCKRMEAYTYSSPHVAEYWRLLLKGPALSSSFTLEHSWNLFKYAVIFSHGLALLGKSEAADFFCKRADQLQIELMRHREIHLSAPVESTTGSSFNFEELIISLFVLAVTHCYFNRANAGAMVAFQSYEVLKARRDEISRGVGHCLLSALIGMAGDNAEDRQHFINKCLASDETDPAPLVHTCHFLVSSLLFPPKNIPYEQRWHLRNIDVTEQDIRILEDYVNRTEAAVLNDDLINPQMVSVDVRTHWRACIFGCRAVICYAKGDTSFAYNCAEKCLELTRSVATPSFFTVMPMFFSLNIVSTLRGAEVSDAYFLMCRSHTPKTTKLLDILRSMVPVHERVIPRLDTEPRTDSSHCSISSVYGSSEEASSNSESDELFASGYSPSTTVTPVVEEMFPPLVTETGSFDLDEFLDLPSSSSGSDPSSAASAQPVLDSFLFSPIPTFLQQSTPTYE
eukprot:GILJ01005776.1.p1 GENE.GILJ01005776.1~~GILJ01005776.1.p1  ORF type:complete len:620 (-),score=90.06 GILJ01005776.1:440-2299(-)